MRLERLGEKSAYICGASPERRPVPAEASTKAFACFGSSTVVVRKSRVSYGVWDWTVSSRLTYVLMMYGHAEKGGSAVPLVTVDPVVPTEPETVCAWL